MLPYKVYYTLIIGFFWVSIIAVPGSAQGQLRADFFSDTTQGCAPLIIRFFDQSTGSPTSWFWDLGNGITSTQRNPTSFYFNPGTYNVKLVVRNAAGADSIIKSQYIRVFHAPSIAFTASDTLGCVPMVVQYTNQTNPGSGVMQSWQWDVGDGTTYTVAEPLHTYLVPGSYTVTLKATNSFGCISTANKPAYVRVRNRIRANFTFTGAEVCNLPANVSFSNTSTSTDPLDYWWDFGDGNTSPAQSPAHTYTATGQYPVKLVIRNSIGCADSIARNVNVVNNAITASFDAPAEVCPYENVQFTIPVLPANAIVLWNFGDSTFSVNPNPIKNYSAPGTYDVQLIVINGNCSDTIVKSITVRQPPQADYTATIPSPGCTLPVAVSFQSPTPGLAAYAWYFGDGDSSTQPNPTHQYTAHGTYTVTLIASDQYGCRDTVIKESVFDWQPPVITGIGGLPYNGCAPFTTDLIAHITSPEQVVAYLWDFGDGNTSNEPSPVYTWTVPGTYPVSLHITTVNGCTTFYRISQAVTISEKPVADFSASPLLACATRQIQFTDQSSANVTDWEWSFGDNGFSSEQNPIHLFMDTGWMTVKLVVKNNECIDSAVKVDYIFIKPPIAYYETSFSCDTPMVRRFTDFSIGANSWHWDFGDGNTSTNRHPVHTYASPGQYLVRLVVQNDTCFDDWESRIWVVGQSSSAYQVQDTMVCYSTTVRYNALQPSNGIVNYAWNFGNGRSASGAQPTVSHTYRQPGTYQTSLTTTDVLGCSYTTRLPVTVSLLGARARFSNIRGTCVNTPVDFNEQSTIHPAYPVVERRWNFGDGNTTVVTQPVVSHQYTAEGIYNVKLTVVDAYGCIDSLWRDSAIIITDPKADFLLADSIRCSNSDVLFYQMAHGRSLQYQWQFGDGNNSSLENPVHQYLAEGVYDVSLTVTDEFGCVANKTDSAAIRIANPVADFILSDTFSNCPPFIAEFRNTSNNFATILWDFDDGSFSNIDTPIHFYSTAGIFNVSLTATGFGNCSTTVVQRINVEGPKGSFSYAPLEICAPGEAIFNAQANNSAAFVWDFGDGNIEATSTPVFNHTYDSAGIYYPRLLMRDSMGCTVPLQGMDPIVVSKTVAGISGINPVYCDTANISILNTTTVFHDIIQSYQWQLHDGSISSDANPSVSISGAGLYPLSLVATSQKGCTDSTTAFIIVIGSPQVNIAGDTVICIDQQAVFTGGLLLPDTSNISWLWNFANGNADTTALPAPQQYAAAGNYTVQLQATNSSGCTNTSSHTLIVHPLPVVSAGVDSIICLGDQLVLQPTGAVNYSWNADPSLNCTNCANPVASPLQDVTYYVTGTSSHGCIVSDSVSITVVQPVSVTVSAPDTLCAGETKTLIASGADHYTWSPAASLSDPFVANPVASPASSTQYQVIGSDYRSCFADTATVAITVYPIPVFAILNPSIIASAGSTVQVQTSSSPDINRWRWLPSTGLSCNDCPQPVLTAMRDLTFRAIASNDGGCATEQQLTVQVTCNNGNVFIPNTFSPNNDGMNDVFYPRGKGINAVGWMRIFNRWGSLVFERQQFGMNDPAMGWNGNYNNQPAPAGVYVYEVEVICENNQPLRFKGNVTLVR